LASPLPTSLAQPANAKTGAKAEEKLKINTG